MGSHQLITVPDYNEAKYNFGKVKTKPMQRCCLGYLGGEGGRGFQGGLQGHCHVLWLELPFRLLASLPSLPPSLPPIFWGKYIILHTVDSLSDVLTGAWEVDCGSVAMVTSLLLRRVLSPPLLPLRQLPSKILAWCFKLDYIITSNNLKRVV